MVKPIEELDVGDTIIYGDDEVVTEKVYRQENHTRVIGTVKGLPRSQSRFNV